MRSIRSLAIALVLIPNIAVSHDAGVPSEDGRALAGYAFGFALGSGVTDLGGLLTRLEGTGRVGLLRSGLALELNWASLFMGQPSGRWVDRRDVAFVSMLGLSTPASALVHGWLGEHGRAALLCELGLQRNEFVVYDAGRTEYGRWTPFLGGRLALGMLFGWTRFKAGFELAGFARKPLRDRECVPTFEGCKPFGTPTIGIMVSGQVDFPVL